ncbi:MAG: FHA domain-containing protein [Gemmataceae bacterium]|nr:FHA domain-containing protein [Gemmataceae bacterium]
MSPEVRLTMVQGMSPGQEYVFHDHTLCTVGRAPDCLLQLPSDLGHLDVSRHHCLLEIDPPFVSVRDLGSKNGTYVNGEMIGRRGWQLLGDEESLWGLDEGDEIRVGGSVFRVSIVGAEALAESAA